MASQERFEASIRQACDAGAYAEAATLALNGYGDEVLGFLIARLRSESEGEEVFGAFAEKLWRGLPGFEWRCSFKSWAYRLARNAANDHASAAHNRPGRHQALSAHADLAELVAQVRTRTQPYRRTDVKDRMQQLREKLPDDDQMLLILRVDREMSWRDLAAAFAEGEATPAGPDLDRESARLRKRFERVKERLRAMAEAEGLL